MTVEAEGALKTDMNAPGVRFLAFMLLATGILPYFSSPILGGVYANSYGFAAAQVAILIAADLVGAAVATLTASLCIHRVNWRPLIGISVLVAAIPNLICPLVESFSALLVLRLGAGLGQGAMLAFAFATIGAMANPDREFGIATALMIVFGGLLILAGHELLDQFGPAGLFATICAVTLLTFAFYHAAPRGNPLSPKVPDASLRSVPSVNTRRCIAVGLLTALLFFIGMDTVWPFSERLGDSIGLSAQEIANILAGSLVCSVIGALTWTLAAGKVNRTFAFSVSILLILVSLVSLTVKQDVAPYIFGLCLFNFSTTFAIPLIDGWISSMDSTGRAVVLVPAVQSLGTPLGPLAASLFIANDAYVNAVYVGIAFYFLCMITYFVAIRLEVMANNEMVEVHA